MIEALALRSEPPQPDPSSREHGSRKAVELTRRHGLGSHSSSTSSPTGRVWSSTRAAGPMLPNRRRVFSASGSSRRFPAWLRWLTLALVRARRGDPDVWPVLDEARALSESTGELIRIAPVAAARAEVAWLAGHPDAVAAETDAASGSLSTPWGAGGRGDRLLRSALVSMTSSRCGRRSPICFELAGDSGSRRPPGKPRLPVRGRARTGRRRRGRAAPSSPRGASTAGREARGRDRRAAPAGAGRSQRAPRPAALHPHRRRRG